MCGFNEHLMKIVYFLEEIPCKRASYMICSFIIFSESTELFLHKACKGKGEKMEANKNETKRLGIIGSESGTTIKVGSKTQQKKEINDYICVRIF